MAEELKRIARRAGVAVQSERSLMGRLALHLSQVSRVEVRRILHPFVSKSFRGRPKMSLAVALLHIASSMGEDDVSLIMLKTRKAAVVAKSRMHESAFADNAKSDAEDNEIDEAHEEQFKQRRKMPCPLCRKKISQKVSRLPFGASAGTCSICLNVTMTTDTAIVTKCNHCFCTACWREHVNATLKKM